MSFKRLVVVFSSILLLSVASTAWANDNIVSEVTIPSGQPTPIIINNGVPNGTIQLWYSVTGTSYPCGTFAQFNLNLTDLAGKNGKAPTYPVALGLVQNGLGTPVQFSPAPSTFNVDGTTWSDSSLVTVSIDCSQISPDTADIVGNLSERTVPSGAHLNTISTIQVHIRLLSSPSACLYVYSFETDQDNGTNLSSGINVVAPGGSVTSTNPGTISVDGLVANTCTAPLSFDIGIGLDSDWVSPSTGQPTKIYTTTGELDPANFTPITSLITSGGTNGGVTLCFQNVTLANDNSFLVTTKSSIKSGLTTANLPGDGDFDFSATLYQAGSSCGTAYPTPSIVNTNPATSALSFTVSP